MARTKILSGDVQAFLAEEYYVSVCHKNADNWTFKGVAQYMTEKTGLQIKEHTVRRCEEVRALWDRIHDDDAEGFGNDVLLFKTLDIDEFLQNNSDIQSLRESLKQRDVYYQNICANAALIFEQKAALCNDRDLLELRRQEMESGLASQEDTISEQKQEIAKLKKTVQKMRKIIEVNVNTEIAVSLLKDIGLLKDDGNDTSTCLNEQAKSNLIISATDSIPDVVEKDSVVNLENKIIQGLFDKI